VLVVPPLCLLLFQQVLFGLFPGLENDSLFTPIFALAMLSMAFIGLPWLLRVFLRLKPLPDGPLRRRLLETARRLRFRFNDILLWDTRHTTANAMVTGFVPFLRYVVVTDRLIAELSQEEIEAVFGHEVGHIKHHHMLYYLGFLLASLAAVGGVWTVVLGALKDDVFPAVFGGASGVWTWLTEYEIIATVSLLTVLSLYIFLVFGFVSRRCERQADIFGSRTVSCGAFIRALEKVASLNGIHRERPGWLSSWQHSTIAKRVAFLRRMDADAAVEGRFQRRVGLVKWGIAFALVAVLTALGPKRVWAVVNPVAPEQPSQAQGPRGAAQSEYASEATGATEPLDVRWWIALGLLGVSVVLFLVASRIRGSTRKTERATPALEDGVEAVEMLPCVVLATALTPPHTAARTAPSE
jgi:STE24 endopeptidase